MPGPPGQDPYRLSAIPLREGWRSDPNILVWWDTFQLVIDPRVVRTNDDDHIPGLLADKLVAGSNVTITAAGTSANQYDNPDACLLLVFYAGHPDCLDLLAHLRAEWPGRYLLTFHKHRCLDAGNAERESQPYEDVLWDAADIRLLTPHAKGDPLYRKFRLAHDLDRADYLLQSCTMSQEEIEQLVGLADGVVGR